MVRARFVGLAILAVALSAASSVAASEPRVVVERYLAGAGDLACVVSGVGCTRFYVEGGESTLHLAVEDVSGRPIAFNACSPTCADLNAQFCAEGAMSGLTPGDQVFVFLHESPLGCILAAPALEGTVTATFT